MKTAIVLTTISIPTVLRQYAENCRLYGHGDVIVIVVGDIATPGGIDAFLESVESVDFRPIYLGPRDQEKILRRSPDFAAFLPYNSVQRRNVGYLHAAELGAEMIISIDDDNQPLPEHDFIGDHSVVGNLIECDRVKASKVWYNTCSHLETSPSRRFYHRGFPLCKRWMDQDFTLAPSKGRVVVNVGLWTGDPDVDTLTRFEEPFQVTAVKEPTRRVSIGKGTFSPFNSQNTAFHRDLLPCLYLISFPAGNPMTEYGNNFRYDDIWMSYFMKILVDHMDDMVCVGPPHVRQLRNEHDLVMDLRRELVPMEMTNTMADVLPEITLTETSYRAAYQELIEGLRSSVAFNERFSRRERDQLRIMLKGMQLWTVLVSQVSA